MHEQASRTQKTGRTRIDIYLSGTSFFSCCSTSRRRFESPDALDAAPPRPARPTPSPIPPPTSKPAIAAMAIQSGRLLLPDAGGVPALFAGGADDTVEVLPLPAFTVKTNAP